MGTRIGPSFLLENERFVVTIYKESDQTPADEGGARVDPNPLGMAQRHLHPHTHADGVTHAHEHGHADHDHQHDHTGNGEHRHDAPREEAQREATPDPPADDEH
jgi:hypothetical protein